MSFAWPVHGSLLPSPSNTNTDKRRTREVLPAQCFLDQSRRQIREEGAGPMQAGFLLHLRRQSACWSNGQQPVPERAWQKTKWAKTSSVYWVNGEQSPVRSWQLEVFCKITASAVVFVLCGAGFCPIAIGSGELLGLCEQRHSGTPGCSDRSQPSCCLFMSRARTATQTSFTHHTDLSAKSWSLTPLCSHCPSPKGWRTSLESSSHCRIKTYRSYGFILTSCTPHAERRV